EPRLPPRRPGRRPRRAEDLPAVAHAAAVDPRHPGADAARRDPAVGRAASALRILAARRRHRRGQEPAAAVAGLLQGGRAVAVPLRRPGRWRPADVAAVALADGYGRRLAARPPPARPG